MAFRKEMGRLEPTSASNDSRGKSAFKLNTKALAIHTTSLKDVQNGPLYLFEILLPRLSENWDCKPYRVKLVRQMFRKGVKGPN